MYIHNIYIIKNDKSFFKVYFFKHNIKHMGNQFNSKIIMESIISPGMSTDKLRSALLEYQESGNALHKGPKFMFSDIYVFVYLLFNVVIETDPRALCVYLNRMFLQTS